MRYEQLIFQVQVLLHVTQCLGVEIPRSVEVRVEHGAKNVTLPCAYVTQHEDRPQVKWYRGDVQSDDLVLRVNTAGQPYPGENYKDRVLATGNADLVLRFPRLNDSSNYSCEVLITVDVPPVAVGYVHLQVIKASAAEQDETLDLAFCLLDIVIVITMIGALIVTRRNGNSSCSQKLLMAVNISAMLLCLLASSLLLVHKETSYHDDLRWPGIIISIVGIACGGLVVIITSLWLRRGEIKNRGRDYDLHDPSCQPLSLIEVQHEISGGPIESSCEDGTIRPVGENKYQRLKAKSELLGRICEKEHSAFVETGVFKAAKQILATSSYVLIVGLPGVGKTTTLKQLCLAFLGKGYMVLDPDSPDAIEANIPDEGDVLLIFDDPFGKVCVLEDRVTAWMQRAGSFCHLQKYLETGRVKLAFACRKMIWNECKASLQDMAMFQYILDASTLELTREMKHDMILNHLRSGGPDETAQPSDEILDEICIDPDIIASPRSCQAAASLQFTPDSAKLLVERFRNPFHFIRDELQQLDHWTYASLVLVMLNGGWLASGDLSDENKRQGFHEMLNQLLDACRIENYVRPFGTLRHKLGLLDGTYLKSEISSNGTLYNFSHDSFPKALAIDYGQENVDMVMKYCDPAFVVSRCRPWTHQGEKDEHTISLPEKYYPQLVALMTIQVFSGQLDVIFSNPVVTDEKVQTIWIQHLQTLDNEKRSIFVNMYIQGEPSGRNILYYSAKTGAEKLFDYLLQEGARPSQVCDYHPIVGAAEGGFVRLVSKFLDDTVVGRTVGDLGPMERYPDQHSLSLNHSIVTDIQITVIQQATFAAKKAGKRDILTLLIRFQNHVEDKELQKGMVIDA